jgi:hypothetical protein
MEEMVAEMKRKREETLASLGTTTSKKYIKRGDVELVRQSEYHKKQAERQKTKSVPSIEAVIEKKKVEDKPHLADGEVMKRLRTAQEPVTLFGEDEVDRYKRLISLENVDVGYFASFLTSRNELKKDAIDKPEQADLSRRKGSEVIEDDDTADTTFVFSFNHQVRYP